MSENSDKNKKSMGNWIIRFLDANGMRPIIALVTILGALMVTVKSNEICVITDTPPPPPSSAFPKRDNPICGKYFEMAALVLGGLLGLANPGNPPNSGAKGQNGGEEPTDTPKAGEAREQEEGE